MDEALRSVPAVCPYCWENICLQVDMSGGGQEYIEDCQVCCHPMTVRLLVDGEALHVDVERAQ